MGTTLEFKEVMRVGFEALPAEQQASLLARLDQGELGPQFVINHGESELDDTDLFDMVVAWEEGFGIALDVEEYEGFSTAGEFVTLIMSKQSST